MVVCHCSSFLKWKKYSQILTLVVGTYTFTFKSVIFESIKLKKFKNQKFVQKCWNDPKKHSLEDLKMTHFWMCNSWNFKNRKCMSKCTPQDGWDFQNWFDFRETFKPKIKDILKMRISVYSCCIAQIWTYLKTNT